MAADNQNKCKRFRRKWYVMENKVIKQDKYLGGIVGVLSFLFILFIIYIYIYIYIYIK